MRGWLLVVMGVGCRPAKCLPDREQEMVSGCHLSRAGDTTVFVHDATPQVPPSRECCLSLETRASRALPEQSPLSVVHPANPDAK